MKCLTMQEETESGETEEVRYLLESVCSIQVASADHRPLLSVMTNFLEFIHKTCFLAQN